MQDDVVRMVIETWEGAYGFWPNRLDCTAVLAPGILTYLTPQEGEVFIAIDEGVVVKTGGEVVVSVRNAFRGRELGKLREAVEQQFLNLEERERNVQSVFSRLESGFIRNFQQLLKR